LLADQSLHRFRLKLSHHGELGVRFVAPEVPAHGYKAFAVRPMPPIAPTQVLREELCIENDLFLVEADPTSGTLTVTDKASGTVFPQLHRFVDGGDRGDEYNYCPPENDCLITAPAEVPACRVVESGPFRQTLEISQVYQLPAGLAPDRASRGDELVRLPISTWVSLMAGVPRIDFRTTVENQALDHRLRVFFPTPIVTGVAHAEGHFDVVERPLALPRDTDDWPEQPTPTHHQRAFVDVNDGRVGLMAANRGLPEYEVIPGEEGVTVALTLLRCVGWLSRNDMHCRRGHAGPALPTPGAQCLGTHTFEYALIPHSGGWENAYAQAYAFNAPLRAVAAPRSGGPLPQVLSFVRADPADFVLTAIKSPEDGKGLIVRGYNITDETQEVTLHLDLVWGRATRVGLDESLQEEVTVEGNSVRFRAAPKQIVTLRFDE
jgi:alpha-mannosidase